MLAQESETCVLYVFCCFLFILFVTCVVLLLVFVVCCIILKQRAVNKCMYTHRCTRTENGKPHTSSYVVGARRVHSRREGGIAGIERGNGGNDDVGLGTYGCFFDVDIIRGGVRAGGELENPRAANRFGTTIGHLNLQCTPESFVGGWMNSGPALFFRSHRTATPNLVFFFAANFLGDAARLGLLGGFKTFCILLKCFLAFLFALFRRFGSTWIFARSLWAASASSVCPEATASHRVFHKAFFMRPLR